MTKPTDEGNRWLDQLTNQTYIRHTMSIFDYFASGQKKSDFGISITDADWDADWPSLVSKQTAKVEVNFVTRQLIFHLRQTAKGVIQDVIFHVLAKETSKIDHICITPGKQKGRYEYHFKNGIVTDHYCDFAYSDDSPILHVLTVQFAEIELKTPSADRRTSVVLKDLEPVEKQQLNG
jgi:hypothetical protein